MSRKYLSIFLLMVVMICCVSVASATDVDNITVPDDTNIITDDIVESVDDVEIDDVIDDVASDDSVDDVVSEDAVDNTQITNDSKIVKDDNVGPTRGQVTNSNYNKYFNTITGLLTDTSGNPLQFTGSFTQKTFTNFRINNNILINATGATFTNVGFSLEASNITFIGGTFITTNNKVSHVIDVSAGDVEVSGVTMNLVAPNNKEFVAINVASGTNVKILNNIITYTCNYVNKNVINYVIRVKNSPNALITGNKINAYLPLKEVAYYTTSDQMDWDRVAVVGIEFSNGFNLSYNNIEVNVTAFDDSYPTLDAVIVLFSEDAYIGHNNVTEIDNVTEEGSANYLYAIDVYSCNHLNIDNNTIKLSSMGGSFINNTLGTSTAYGIQLTGGHNVTIANNDIDTRNNGPNAGIYSQNYGGPTNLTIVNNTIYAEGNAGSSSWSLVTGMELQDNYGYIAGNKITVYNKQGYVNGSNAYGISYSQWGMADPVFNITHNCVNLINGDYAVYIKSSDFTTYVTDNCLTSTNYVGDNAVFHTTNVVISGNHNCTCTNCPVHP